MILSALGIWPVPGDLIELERCLRGVDSGDNNESRPSLQSLMLLDYPSALVRPVNHRRD